MLGLYGIISGKKLEHYIWSAFSLAVAFWGFGIYKIATSTLEPDALFWWKVAEIGVILIPVFFFNFIVEYLKIRQKAILALVYLSGGIYLYFDVFTNLYVTNVRYAFNSFYYIGRSDIFTSFIVLFVIMSAYSIYLLFKKYISSSDPSERMRIRYLFVIFTVAFIGGCSSYLPVFGIEVLPLANVMIFPCILAIFYLIFWQKFLNSKNILTQILTLFIWIVLVIRIFFANDMLEIVFDTGIFLLSVLLGIFLIRSVIKEVESREKAEKLTIDFQKANDRLRELDVQKTEFISFASHQLRAPLTAMKGYASLIVEGDLGEVSGKVSDAVSRMFESAKTMTSVVDDYLNVSRIELGSMKYELEPLDMKTLVSDVVAELKPNIDKAGLKFDFKTIGEGPWTVSADPDKLKQVVANIIDNSVKYTPSGSLAVALGRVPNKDGTIPIRFSVTDTGIGIAPLVMPKLFQKFSRADNANKQNIHGTGLGLFIVREIVNAHHGRVWAESAGEGKGSKFIVELPAA